jgi:hypothetical protein
VFVWHLWNDFKLFALSDPEALIREWEALAPKQGSFEARGATPLLDWLSRHSQTICRLRAYLLARRLEHVRGFQEGRTYPSTSHLISSAGLDFYRQNLERMATVTAGHNIPLVIVKQPTLVRPDNTLEERAKIRYQYAGLDHPTLVEAYAAGWKINDELCQREGIYCIPANEEIRPSLEFFSDQVHLTAAGRKAMADVLDRSLAEIFGDFHDLLRLRP